MFLLVARKVFGKGCAPINVPMAEEMIVQLTPPSASFIA
jgi:hypothetical protein